MTINQIFRKYGKYIKDYDSETDDCGTYYFIYLKKPYVSDNLGYVMDEIRGYPDDLAIWFKSIYTIDPKEWDNL